MHRDDATVLSPLNDFGLHQFLVSMAPRCEKADDETVASLVPARMIQQKLAVPVAHRAGVY